MKRILIHAIYISLIFILSPAFSDEPPVSFKCELKRICELSVPLLEKNKECRNVSGHQVDLIFYEREGFWFNDLKYEFDREILTNQSEYIFAGSAKVRKLDLALGTGFFHYRRTIHKNLNNLMAVEASHQQIFVRHYICKN